MKQHDMEKAQKRGKTVRPEELPKEFKTTGRGRIPSDVQGSYTGIPVGIPGEDIIEQPVQDADDL
jgi:hypothetical protein